MNAVGRPPATIRGRAVVVALAAVIVVGGALAATRPWDRASACPQTADASWSVARRWDEALLDAIRRALPNPPVHARNLFHLSVAMWDAWAVYDPTAVGYIVKEKLSAPDVAAARNEAISYAAYRVLSARFIKAVGADKSLSEFADVMDALCYPIAITGTDGTSPPAIGNRIAQVLLDTAKNDGSNEANGYGDPTYASVNPPLVVAKPGITLTDPNRWQPLQLERMISQNGVAVTNGVQQSVGPHWGHVTPFAIPAGGGLGVPIDPGPPPRFGDAATDAIYRAQAVDIVRDSSLLDAASDVSIDISPGTLGANTLGSNDGHGHPRNPATGAAYAAEPVRQGDFYRALAEFWADGPSRRLRPDIGTCSRMRCRTSSVRTCGSADAARSWTACNGM
jgi:hypothetical protein